MNPAGSEQRTESSTESVQETDSEQNKPHEQMLSSGEKTATVAQLKDRIVGQHSSEEQTETDS